MESGGGGLFMKLAPELLLVFLNYLYLHDIAKLRRVSKWFDERICSLMPSKFRSFKIRLGERNMEESCESILRAMKKPYGHLNLLVLDIQNYNGQDCRLKEILNDYKDNISALDLSLYEDLGSDMVSFLQHENTIFQLLEKLSIEKDKRIENLLKKHAEQLTYLKLSYARKNPHNYPHFPKLETLIVEHIHPDDLVSLLSLCSESLSTLRIRFMYKEWRPVLQQLPELPKLQTLELYRASVGETVKSLISKCRQTLTELAFKNMDFEFDLEDKYFPKLKYLKFQSVYSKDMIKNMISANACQLETLILQDRYYFILPNPLSNIKNLFSRDYINLVNILKCASSLQCLVLRCYDEDSDLEYLKDIKKMPNLTDIYLLDIDARNWFMYKSIKDFLIKNADTLEFLLVHFFLYSSNMESTPPPVELKKVHTLIIPQEHPFLESGREFFKALCPNAQIIMKNGKRGEYIREAVKLRLKYHKADDLFFQEINDMISF